MENKKQIGIVICTALVVGNMIGSGIFLLPASLAVYGGISIAGWIFTSLGAIFLALVFGTLAEISPKSGGPFIYAQDGLGRFAGFLVAWGHWIGVWTGNAAIAVAFTSYLSVFWPALSASNVLSAAVTLGLIWTLTLVNIMGIRTAGIVQVVTTILKVIPIIGLATIGLFFVDWDHFTPLNRSEESNISAITACAALTLWAYLGLESATVPAGDVKDPKTTIPRATVVGTILTAAIYILSTVAVLGIVNPEALSTSVAPFADAGKVIGGDWVFYLVGAGAVISCLGALNGWMILQAQVPMAAAENNYFPSIFARKNKSGTPVAGILVSSVLISILIMTNFTRGLVELFTFIILLATLTTLIPYIFSAMSQMMILMRYRKVFSRKRLIKDLLFASLAFIYSLWAIGGSGQEVVYWGLIALLGGVPIYVIIQWRRGLAPNGGDETRL